jgi:hypothetical protein
MLRIRVTFTVNGVLGSLTHELLITGEIDNDVIKQRLNDELVEMLTSDLQPITVKDIILVVPFPQFSP